MYFQGVYEETAVAELLRVQNIDLHIPHKHVKKDNGCSEKSDNFYNEKKNLLSTNRPDIKNK